MQVNPNHHYVKFNKMLKVQVDSYMFLKFTYHFSAVFKNLENKSIQNDCFTYNFSGVL